jgi:N-acetylglucosamine kinase-like BadF-type ATPase
MTKYFLGIDIGSTKSHALIADENGQAVGFGEAGAGNWESVGWEQTRQVIQDITKGAIESAKIKKDEIAGAGFGIAGFDWPEDREMHSVIIESLHLKAPYFLTNDTIIGLVAGATEGWGVVVSAGTSNNCRGRDKNGKEGRFTGAGHTFAEYGGAYEIVRKSIQAVSLAWSMRGPETILSQKFMEITGAKDMMDFFAGLIRNRYSLSAAQAPVVFKAADSGDEVAQGIIRWAGQELGGLALGVARQLNFVDLDFEVVMAGSLYKGGPRLIDALHETIHAEAPGAQLVRLEAPPVVGGVLLGMEQVGVKIADLRPKLLETTPAFLQNE